MPQIHNTITKVPLIPALEEKIAPPIPTTATNIPKIEFVLLTERLCLASLILSCIAAIHAELDVALASSSPHSGQKFVVSVT
jgi:hypothetical protein